MVAMSGSLFAFACAVVLVNAGIVINNNGCPVSANYEMLLPHEACNKFYHCVNGRLVSRECPDGLLFNKQAKTCDWPQNVVCERKSTPEVAKHIVNPSDAPVICASPGSDGLLVPHEKCNQFYKCTHGLPVPLYCPNDLLYNPSQEVCDWNHNVKCEDRIISEDSTGSNNEGSGNENNDDKNEDGDEQTGSTNCDPSEAPTVCAKTGSNGVLVAHEHCNRFYKCTFGHPVALDCPAGLLYNSKLEICDWLDKVDCGNRLMPEEKDNDALDKDKEHEQKEQDIRDDPSKAQDICAEEGSNHILIAHEKCDHFYQCFDSKPVSLKCPNNLFYNPINTWCDFPHNVDCTHRILPLENDPRV